VELRAVTDASALNVSISLKFSSGHSSTGVFMFGNWCFYVCLFDLKFYYNLHISLQVHTQVLSNSVLSIKTGGSINL